MDWIGILLSFLYLFAVLGMAEGIRRLLRLPRELTREMVHIGVSFWGIPAYYLFHSSITVAIPPIVFTIINFFSYKFDIFKAMELKGKIGTILYPLSLVFLFPFFWKMEIRTPAIAGLLVMGLGDGFAGMLGSRFGKMKYKIFGEKTMEGTIAMFSFSFIAVFSVLLIFHHNLNLISIISISIITSIMATLVESFTPSNFDNITVPVISSFVFWGGLLWLS